VQNSVQSQLADITGRMVVCGDDGLARRLNPRLRLVIRLYNRKPGQHLEELLDGRTAGGVEGVRESSSRRVWPAPAPTPLNTGEG
jgi:hypothetical protein